MTNNEAIGYMLLTCKRLGLDKQLTIDLFHEMTSQFDWKTEEEAEELGFKWLKSIEE